MPSFLYFFISYLKLFKILIFSPVPETKTPKKVEASKTRKEAHRAVEKRRRTSINTGIQDLSKLVPGFHKSKGNVIQRTVDYVRELQTNVTQHEKG